MNAPQAELAVAIINPRQARDFAKATGQLAKTDALDKEHIKWLEAQLKEIESQIKDAIASDEDWQ